MSNRVVITGIGTVNALGQDVPSYWDAVKAGKSAIRPIEGFDTSGFRSKLGAEVRGFDASKFADPMKLRRMDLLSQMVLVASMEAMKDSGIDGDIPAERLGIVIGNGYGGTSFTDAFIEGLLVNGPSGVNPMLFPTTVPNSAASHTSIMLGIKGPNSTFCQKDVSAEQAIIYAAELLRKGAADAVIAGGGEELSDVMYHAFDALWVLSPGHSGDPEDEGCRPFDRRRNGRVLGEGAGVLVLETLESAKKRGAKIYAEITGWSQSSGNAGISKYNPSGRALGLERDAYGGTRFREHRVRQRVRELNARTGRGRGRGYCRRARETFRDRAGHHDSAHDRRLRRHGRCQAPHIGTLH